MESNSKKIYKGISSQTFVTVLTGLLEIAVFSVMSRLLTKEDFGLFASVTAITVIFSSLSEAGIGAAIIQKKDPSRTYINTAFTISLLSGIFFSLLLVLFSAWFSDFFEVEHLQKALMMMSVTILCHCLTSVNNALLYKHLAFLKVGFVNLSSLLISSGIAIFLAYKGMGFYSIVTKAVVSAILTTLISFILVHFNYEIMVVKEDVSMIVGFAGWLTLSVIIRNLAHQADKLLMTKYLSVTSLGAYNRPKEFITNITTKLNSIFDTVLFPVLSNIQDEKEKMKKSFDLSLYYLNVFSLVLSLGFIFNGELIIRIFFGEQWLSLMNLFRILSIYMLLYTDGRLCDCYFRSIGIVKYQFYLRIFELLITFSFLLVSFRWDMMGVAIAILMVQLVMVFTKLVIISRHLRYPIINVFKTILSSWKCSIVILPIMVLFIYLLPHTLTGNILLLVGFLITLLLIFLKFPSIVGHQYVIFGHNAIITKLLQLKNKIYGK